MRRRIRLTGTSAAFALAMLAFAAAGPVAQAVPSASPSPSAPASTRPSPCPTTTQYPGIRTTVIGGDRLAIAKGDLPAEVTIRFTNVADHDVDLISGLSLSTAYPPYKGFTDAVPLQFRLDDGAWTPLRFTMGDIDPVHGFPPRAVARGGTFSLGLRIAATDRAQAQGYGITVYASDFGSGPNTDCRTAVGSAYLPFTVVDARTPSPSPSAGAPSSAPAGPSATAGTPAPQPTATESASAAALPTASTTPGAGPGASLAATGAAPIAAVGALAVGLLACGAGLTGWRRRKA